MRSEENDRTKKKRIVVKIAPMRTIEDSMIRQIQATIFTTASQEVEASVWEAHTGHQEKSQAKS